MQSTLQRPYALALLTLIRDQDGADVTPPLGIALRYETATSKYNLPAHRLLQALIEHSPSPETVACQFMAALERCEKTIVVEDSVDQVRTLECDRSTAVSPSDWAATVHKKIKQDGVSITPLTGLAENYLNGLVIPFINPGGKKTPTSSQASPTGNPQAGEPAISQNSDIDSLLKSATLRNNQSSLKELVYRRDGDRCLITGFPFLGRGRMPSNCAHIIPLSVYTKTVVHSAIEMFTGSEVRAADVQNFINHPVNAINIENGAHVSMDQHLAWGIEAIVNNDNNTWKYYFRVVRPDDIYGSIQLNDGDEIVFGQGKHGKEIAFPSPQICNLHLAIARVFAASGAAEVLDKIMKDEGEDQFPLSIADEVSRRLIMLVTVR